MGNTAPAPGGTTTQRKTMEQVQENWCSETAMVSFSNIPICDAQFELDDLFQMPVDHQLEGPVPEQMFFNIQKAWASECSLPILVFSWGFLLPSVSDASRDAVSE